MVEFFLAIAFLHLFTYLSRFVLILRYRPAEGCSLPGFSVIVCARNEEVNLRSLVPALMQQEYEHFEVLIILDRCTDQSYPYLEEVQKKFPRLKVMRIETIPEGWNGKKYSLTRGIQEARHDWILLTDADCRPASAQWIRSFASLTDSVSVIIGISPYKTERSFLNRFICYETLLTAFFYISSAIRQRPYMGVGRNLAYRKSVFEKVNGFDGIQQVTGGDDDLLIQKMNLRNQTRVAMDKKSLTISLPKRKWKEYLHQKLRHLHAGKFYNPSIRWMHIIRSSGHLLLWLSFLYLVVNKILLVEIAGIFLIILALKGIFLQVCARKMGIRFDFLFLPAVDLAFAIFIPIIGITAALLKKVKWT